ncbi:MAG: hypothetical protein OXC08_03155 [Thiotrichales bacterium]|nr:hypothetical protein [Thiotrichales bacterium]
MPSSEATHPVGADRAHADKYRCINRPVHLVAVEFSKETRRVVAFETAQAGP